jgi:hypothetical protein
MHASQIAIAVIQNVVVKKSQVQTRLKSPRFHFEEILIFFRCSELDAFATTKWLEVHIGTIAIIHTAYFIKNVYYSNITEG